jgi:D-alanyl-D-alanine carboxypeptidase (penicillin-binding protein 5/6)
MELDPDDPSAHAPPPPIGPPGPTRAIAGATPLSLPKVHAASAILLDAETGQVIYEKDADSERPMASTTKIMTALLFCENVPEQKTITASKNACKIHNCSLHLKPGEQVSAHDLLRAMLIRSANDTCVAAAEQVSGSEAAFVARMNARAMELGALHTHFANPHGLTAPDHYTTARDLATIAREVVKQQRIMDVVKLLDCTINRSIRKNDCNLHNYTHFVDRYSGAEGLKSGWTTPSGHCYVGVASRKGWRLISVVLKSPEYGADTISLMNFGFNNFERVYVANSGVRVGDAPIRLGVAATVPAQTLFPLRVVVRKNEADRIEKRCRYEMANAPITAGKSVGAYEAWVGGQPLSSVPLVSMTAVNAAPRAVAIGRLSGRKLVLGFGVFALGLVSLRYGNRKRIRFSTFAKGARSSGPRFTANLRDDNLLR